MFFGTLCHFYFCLFPCRPMAAGESYSSPQYQFRVGKSTVLVILKEVTQAVTSFPNCLGITDGKYIRVKKPLNSGSGFIITKSFFLLCWWLWQVAIIILLPSMLEHMAPLEIPECLKTLPLFKKILAQHNTLPPPKPLPGTTTVLPYVFVSENRRPQTAFWITRASTRHISKMESRQDS